MQANRLAAGILLTVVWAGTASAQTVPYPRDERPASARQHASSSAGRHADRTRSGVDPSATQPAGLRGVVTTITSDVTGVLNTMFGVRDGHGDDPDAVARE